LDPPGLAVETAERVNARHRGGSSPNNRHPGSCDSGRQLPRLIIRKLIKVDRDIGRLYPVAMIVPDWITVKQVAALCGVSRAYLYRHRGDGHAPPHHRRGRKVLYNTDEVNEWIAGQRGRAAKL
jgi:excisionase family DNA binding protein